MGSDRQEDGLENKILSAVDEIIKSGEFQKLNSVVSETVSVAMSEVGKQLEAAGKSAKAAVEKEAARTEAKDTCAKAEQQAKEAYVKAAQQVKEAARNLKAEKKQDLGSKEGIVLQKHGKLGRNKLRRVGSASGGWLQTIGGIFCVIFGFQLADCIMTFFPGGGIFRAEELLENAVCFLLSAAVISIGKGKVARIKRAERYLKLMQGKSYINLNELALLSHKEETEILTDIKRMIKKGIFPEGHLDVTEKCLIIGDAAYSEYIQLERSRQALLAEEQEVRNAEKQSAEHDAEQAAQHAAGQEIVPKADGASDASQERPAELETMIQEGRAYIKQFRELNDLIEGEEISAKLFHLENVLKEIFEQLAEHPEQMPQMHKFMEYYLPTTLKLVTAYEEFDGVSAPGEDILASKREIEKTLDTINLAFEELLNKMFQARVYDVTTDAQVLQTMLAREGLTREPVFAERAVENTAEPLKMESLHGERHLT